MTAAHEHIPDRLYELLADQAVQGLNDVEARELDALLRQHPEIDAESFDIAAAAINMSFAADDLEDMPDDLAARLSDRADAWISSEMNSHSPRPVQRQDKDVVARLHWTPWLVAAACLALAAVAWFSSPITAPQQQGVAERFAQFVNQPPADLVQVEWGAVGQGIEMPETFSGEVVWSDTRNEGYMVFDGLPQNDPSQEQYQLWVFDESRPEATPVDGGVFDIDETGRVIVPIDTKIPVRRATAFAVTVEEPGGVVVSSRERIATLAAVAQPG